MFTSAFRRSFVQTCPPRPAADRARARRIGNQSLQRLLANGAVWAKLRVAPANDIQEQEADRIADSVLRAPIPPPGQIPHSPDAQTGETQIARRRTRPARTVSDANVPHDVTRPLGPGRPLDAATRSFFEPRFGADFSQVRVHTDALASDSANALDARAYTAGRNVVFSAGQFAPNTSDGRRLLAHELAHTAQQGAAHRVLAASGQSASAVTPTSGTIQRAMKFELQTRNRIWRNDGATASLLPRKYGPDDFLVKGDVGSADEAIRLESETHGVLEFETGWFRKWSALKKRLSEAVEMTKKMNDAPDVASGRKAFPFDVDHLRKGTRKEVRRGTWERRKGKEGAHEKILKEGERLEVEIRDATWNAGIQSSESFLLSQYESFLKQHEWPDYKAPVIADAQAILDDVKTEDTKPEDVVNLRNFLLIIINYIMRGQGGEKSDLAGTFADVEGMPSKQAFTLMSRTNFASMYGLLSKSEKGLYVGIVRNDAILKKLGMTRRTRFYIKGYGSQSPHTGPTVHDWLKGIHNGTDLLSGNRGHGLSAAMGRFGIRSKGKHKGLVRFETRNRPMSAGGAFREAKNWVDYAEDLFLRASVCRDRPGDKTDLEYDGSKRFDPANCP